MLTEIYLFKVQYFALEKEQVIFKIGVETKGMVDKGWN